MAPERRIAAVSVAAASFLLTIKLVTGLATGSLGLVSDALHSGTDLIAALLTLFAVGVAGRPADPGHPWGHGKAEHLAALAEAVILVAASGFIAVQALAHIFGSATPDVDTPWYSFVVLGVVIAVDASRTLVSFRGARLHGSAALEANALHFASDLLASTAVLIGLLLVASGITNGDSAAALFVAALVLVAAARLIRTNIDVLMDRTPQAARDEAQRAIEALDPPVELRRLRMRQAGKRYFADVVIGVPLGAAVGQGHAAADAVEDAIHAAVPDSDVVVHVEPQSGEGLLRERALAAAMGVPRVREVHNLVVMTVEGKPEISLHLKLPGEISLEDAHDVSSDVERAIEEAVPEVGRVQTHIEPLSEPAAGASVADGSAEQVDTVRRIVLDVTGRAPREVRLLRTDEGVVAFVTLALHPTASLAEAHASASEVEERIRQSLDSMADVIVHTEP